MTHQNGTLWNLVFYKSHVFYTLLEGNPNDAGGPWLLGLTFCFIIHVVDVTMVNQAFTVAGLEEYSTACIAKSLHADSPRFHCIPY